MINYELSTPEELGRGNIKTEIEIESRGSFELV
jgi:hypothetical protein